MNSKENIKGLIAINIAAVIFGSAALYGKLNVSVLWIVAMRGIFAAITLLGIGIARKQIIDPKQNIIALISTGIILAMHWITFFLSVQLSGIAIATLTFAAFPLFTLIIEALKKRRHLKAKELFSGVIIIAAVALLVRIDANSTALLKGTICGIASAVLFAFFGLMSKKLTAEFPTLTVSFFQNLTVFVVLLPFLPFSTPIPSEIVEWTFLVLLGVVTTALMHQLYFYALKRLSASTCSGFVALEPVYAIFFAAIFFSEPVTITVVVSGLLILLASFLLFSRTFNNVIKM
jgi:drug/metabolite transporter (DMT)-like permease